MCNLLTFNILRYEGIMSKNVQFLGGFLQMPLTFIHSSNEIQKL